MKIKEFNEKVCIGSEVVFEGKVRQVRDINRKTHEASLGRSELWVRCSEFEPYYGGEVPPYVADKEPLVKLGRIHLSFRSVRRLGNIPSHDQ